MIRARQKSRIQSAQNAEGVSYAIIIGNILVPLIEKITMPIAFGKEAKNEKR